MGRRMQLLIDEYRCSDGGGGGESVVRQALVNMKMVLSDSAPAVIPNFEFLCVGSVGAAYAPASSLRSHGITHIINVTQTLRCKHSEDFTYLVFGIADSPDTDLFASRHMDRIFKLFEEARIAGGRVLVHCYQGRSRSVSVVIAYLIKAQGYQYESALALVRSVRAAAQPNHGFEQQLRALEQACRASSSKDN